MRFFTHTRTHTDTHASCVCNGLGFCFCFLFFCFCATGASSMRQRKRKGLRRWCRCRLCPNSTTRACTHAPRSCLQSGTADSHTHTHTRARDVCMWVGCGGACCCVCGGVCLLQTHCVHLLSTVSPHPHNELQRTTKTAINPPSTCLGSHCLFREKQERVSHAHTRTLHLS